MKSKSTNINLNRKQDQDSIEDQFVVIMSENAFDKDFQELGISIPIRQDPVPPAREMRPFYYMRKIEKSISEGGFITEQLYIPKYVWYQKDA